jgi:hypothetical protein
MQDSVDVLDKALLVLALCVDGRRRGVRGLLAAHGEGDAGECHAEGGNGELYAHSVSQKFPYNLAHRSAMSQDSPAQLRVEVFGTDVRRAIRPGGP